CCIRRKRLRRSEEVRRSRELRDSRKSKWRGYGYVIDLDRPGHIGIQTIRSSRRDSSVCLDIFPGFEDQYRIVARVERKARVSSDISASCARIGIASRSNTLKCIVRGVVKVQSERCEILAAVLIGQIGVRIKSDEMSVGTYPFAQIYDIDRISRICRRRSSDLFT